MARILVVDDDATTRRLVASVLRSLEHEMLEAAGAEQALSYLRGPQPIDLVISDVQMEGMDGLSLLKEIKQIHPQMLVVMITAFGSIATAVSAMRLGAYDYIPKPLSVDLIRQVASRALQMTDLRNENQALRREIERLSTPHEFLTFGSQTAGLLEVARQSAASEAGILLTGESGVGKSLLAAYIHRQSARCDGPFVEIACTTLSEHLLESELFGHVRGAFTGAIKDKPGRLEAAHRGTVFLDEIGELPLVLQAKLLRFLQEKAFERVGANNTITVDARIIAATNQDLETLVKQKRFREDLYYRINVIELHPPPLRERPEEILPLAERFIEQAALNHRKRPVELDPKAKTVLLTYPWPGNVRELRNVSERAVILCRGDRIGVEDLPDKLMAGLPVTPARDDNLTLDEIERKRIEVVLQQAVTLEEAAEMLGINVSTLWRKRRRYGLDRPSIR